MFTDKSRASLRFLVHALLGVGLVSCCAAPLPAPPPGPTNATGLVRKTAIAPPLGAVCRLNVIRKKVCSSATYFSSAAYIGNGVVLTAGHNLHSMLGDSVESVGIECGVTERHASAGQLVGFTRGDVAISPEYHFKFYPQDSALLRVPPAAAAGAFEVAPDDLPLAAGDDVHIAGFPGDGYTGHGEFLFAGVGKVLKVTDLYILYGIETTTGNSGGPVWVERDGHFYLVGVHISGVPGATREGTFAYGTARRVSRSRLAELEGYFGTER